MNKQTQKDLLNLVKCNYEEIADDFSETRKKYLWPELLKLTQDVKNTYKVLDVGCGNGRLLEAFKDKKIEYLGVDPSEKLIKAAKTRYQNYRFMIGNILELSKIPDVEFNYIFSIAVLHHIPGKNLQIDALKQLRNKVKDKGKIIITVWNLWSQRKFRKLLFKYTILKIIGKNKMDFGDIIFTGFKQGSQRYYHGFRKRELKKIIKKSGLKIERIYRDKYNYYAVLKK